jgi:hypothetical protein
MALSFSPAGRARLRDFFICLSLSNLFFLRRWYDIQKLQAPSMDYFRPAPTGRTLLAATVLSILLLALGLWLLAFWIKRSGKPALERAARCGLMLAAIFPIETIRRYWTVEKGSVDLGTSAALLAIEIMLLVGVPMLLTGQPRVFVALQKTLLTLVFLFPAMLMDYAWAQSGAEPQSVYAARRPLPYLPPPADSTKARRFIWVLFDEFDQKLAFDERPPGVKLPQLDRLRRESFVADHAVAVANETVIAIPSLFSGRVFTHADAVNARTLMVQPEGSQQRLDWRTQATLFQKARALGINSALVGWHHPYCRVLGDRVVDCFNEPSYMFRFFFGEIAAEREGVWRTAGRLFYRLWLNITDLIRPESESRSERLKDRQIQQSQLEQYLAIRDHAYRDAADPRIGLLFLHFPTPHLFAIYDGSRNDFSLSDRTNYFDNLALVDRTVGELRGVLERAGLWESTTVLVTSDHGLRDALWHDRLNWSEKFDQLLEDGMSPTVPFILKLAGRHKALEYVPEFSAVVTADMALAVLRGDLNTPDDVAAWLSRDAAPQKMAAVQNASR